MTFTLRFADHGEAIGEAYSVLCNNIAATGLDRPVPTTPGWNTRDLLVHAGVELRWVTASLQGAVGAPDTQHLISSLAEFPDPLDWLEDACVETLNELVATPEDARPWVLLENAPEIAREAWARFLAHELTIHGIDSMAARLGRAPHAGELWFSSQLALDGIDNHLRGFVPRWEQVLHTPEEHVIAVLPDDTAAAVESAEQSSDADLSALAKGWTVRFGPEGVRVELGAVSAGTTVRGSAAAVLAALWNRGEDARVEGDAAPFAEFRDRLRIT